MNSSEKWLVTLTVVLCGILLGVISAPASDEGTTFELILLHNNDMHARFEQTDEVSSTCTKEDAEANKCFGGFARVANLVRKYRYEAQQPNGIPVLYLNAGDTYTGTPWFTIYKHNITSEFMNLLAPDAISLGNHEFDKGVSGLVPFLESVTFPVLIANMDASKEPTLESAIAIKKSTIFTIGSKTIGVIGYLTPETKQITPVNAVQFTNEIDAINTEAKVLKDQGVTILIALGHSGHEMDQKIAAECADIDLVVGGHSHSFLYSEDDVPSNDLPVDKYPTVVKQNNGKEVPVVQAYAFTKYLGKMHLKFDDAGNLIEWDGAPILLDFKIEREEDVLAHLELYRQGVDEINANVVGKTKVLLDGNSQSCRRKECNLGNMITDSMIYTYIVNQLDPNYEYWSDAAIALIQGGGIRASVSSENVTMADILTVLPFDDVLVTLELTGIELRETLEFSVHRVEDSDAHGEFLQMSGIHFVYDVSKKSGERVQSVDVLCASCAVPQFKSLVDNETYKLVTTLFLAQGGDGYEVLAAKEHTVLPLNDADALAQFISMRSPVYPNVEWRITSLTTEIKDDEPDAASTFQVSMTLLFLVALSNLLINFT